MRLLTLLLVMFSFRAHACGGGTYVLKTEVEINGTTMHPTMVVRDNQLAEITQSKDGRSTSFQVRATESCQNTHSPVLSLSYKVVQKRGSVLLAQETMASTARYGQPAEVRVDEEGRKPTRVLVTASKR